MPSMKICCWNSKCQHYWEDMCTRETDEKNFVHLDYEGKCRDFVAGESDWYKESEVTNETKNI